jgi:hypothetical protein
MEYSDKAFADSREVIDGNRYENCTFARCGIVYCGGEIPGITGCNFDECEWHFEDAAERTLAFLHFFYHGMGDEGRSLVDQTMNLIRQPAA